MNKKAYRILITGIVQGVGFRPFIYRLATNLNLKGYVRNLGGSEVEVIIEGFGNFLDTFLVRLRREKPKPALIESINTEEIRPNNFTDFKILKSGTQSKFFSMIPPDIGICDACIREIIDPKSRWYMYPFNSCAWCGPRFSIIETIPYDRSNTSMRDFPLCDTCYAEYSDPKNIRRFHAQGISCPICGPRMQLVDRDGNAIDEKDPIKVASKLIDEGSIIAIKGLGGFHIAALATDDNIVKKLRLRKQRPYKPFAIMALDINTARNLVEISPRAEEILAGPEKPILLLPKKKDSPVSDLVAPGLDTLGVMLPYTGIHYILLMYVRDHFLIMTSGNKRNKPICIDFKCAKEQLSDFIDYYLIHNRRIINRVDDSVIRFTDGHITMLRRARGFAPTWFELPFSTKHPLIAFGAELQNAGGIGFENKAVLTQFVGDTDSFENLSFLESAIKFLIKAYKINLRESYIVTDMHPLYASRMLAEKWSEKYKINMINVQHHHAHIASVMAEKKVSLHESVIGISIDGIGYGSDGSIWGGEVLLSNYYNFKRIGHLIYQPMPGGDLAIKEPLRMLIGILSSFYDYGELLKLFKSRMLLKYLKGNEDTLEMIYKVSKSKIVPRTSSIGRVLDAISALLGVCFMRTYEGEPAIKLEAFARGGKLLDQIYAPVKSLGEYLVVDTNDLFRSIIENIEQDPKSLALSAQYALGFALGNIASSGLRSNNVSRVLVGGGAAVNTYIFRGIRDALSNHDIKPELPSKIPCGDGSIALGQIAISMSRLTRNQID
ncbi:MAG: carbamoyltransferase HypF [Candidatus Njordarchaeum guaymaensis]